MNYYLNTYIVLEVINAKVLKKDGNYDKVVRFFDSIKDFQVVTDSRGKMGIAYLVTSDMNANTNFNSEGDVDILNYFYDSEAFSFIKKLADQLDLFLGSVFVLRSVHSEAHQESVKKDCDFIPVFQLPPL